VAKVQLNFRVNWVILHPVGLPLKNAYNMRYHYLFLNLIITLAFGFSIQAQSGWTQTKHGFYLQASAATFHSNKYYSTSGQLFDQGSTFRTQHLLIYGAYGLNDRLTATINLPVLQLNSFNTTETIAGIGSIRLGGKYRILKNFPLAFQVELDIPTNDGISLANAKEPNDIGIIEQINLPTSDGEFNIWSTLAVSKSSSNGQIFGSVYSSTNFRTKGYSHQWQAGLEIGCLLFDQLYLIGKAKVQDDFTNTPKRVGSFLYGEGTSFTEASITGMYKLNNSWHLIASYTNNSGLLIKQRNSYQGTTFSLGLAIKQ
jgi:hypothetical protein